MATTYTDNGGGAANGSDLEFTFTFPVIQTEDVKVALNGVTQATTKYAVNLSSNPTKITFNNTSIDSSVQESSGAPKTGVRVRVYRETTVGKTSGDDDPKAVFAAGSSIRATDLNANVEQALYAIHELQNRPIETEDIQNSAVTSDKIEDGTIVNADINASAAIDGTKISPNFGSQNIVTSGTVDGRDVSTDGSKLDGIEAGATADQSASEIRTLIGSASDSNVLTDNLLSKLNAIEAGATADQTNAEIRAAVEAASDSNVFTDADHSKLNAIDANATDDQTASEIKTLYESNSNTNELTDAEKAVINGVTATTAELNLNDGQTATPTEVNILDGATVTTTEINKLDGFTGSAADLNEVVTGKNVVETITGSATDAQIPTAQAVNERVVELVTEVGGFVPIANETSFPATNPDINDGAGTIVSIKALSSNLTSSGSGVATIANGAGTGNTVTINGMSNSTTYAAGKGLILETTTTLHTYNFHRLVLDETGVASIQVAIDDWDERYYGPLGSAPSTRPSGASRVQGDLYFSTADNQMKVWNNAASQWDDVASSASSNIVTLTPAFNNSETEFTCSTVPVDAQSLLLSINGVVQKPNSGTSTPSEGFVKLANGKIKLATAPASGADYFAIALGNTVSVGTPSPNTVGATELKTGEIANTHISSSAAIAKSKLAALDIVNADINASAAIAKTKLASLDIVNADVNASAAIAGSKISPDFGSQNIITTGGLTVDTNTLHVDSSNNRVGIQTATPRAILDLGTNADAATISNTPSDYQLGLNAAQSTTGDIGRNIGFIALGSGTVTAAINSVDGGTNDTTSLAFWTGNGTAISEAMRIDSSGKLAVGTTTPYTYGIATFNDSNGIVLEGSSQGRLLFRHTGGGTNLKMFDLASSDGVLKFRTIADNGTTVTERMRIDSSGRVGIGETSMDALLVIKGNSDASTTPSIRLKDGTDTREAWISNASGDLVLANGGNDNTPHCNLTMFDGNIMQFNTANTERMRIDSSGQVLIGETSAGGTCKLGMSFGNAVGNYMELGGTQRSANGLNKVFVFRHGYWGGSREVASMGVTTTSSSGGSGRGYGALSFLTGSSGNGDGGSDSTETMRIEGYSGRCVKIGDGLSGNSAGRLQVVEERGSDAYNDCNAYFETNAPDWNIKTYYNRTGSHYHMSFVEQGTDRGYISGSDGSNVTYQSGSDYRWKENVVRMTGTEGIDICKKLKPSKYNWIENRETTGEINTVDGFIAHEVVEAGVTGAVVGEKDAVNEDGSIKGQMLDYGQVTPVLTAAIKGLIDKVEVLETKVAALEAA